MRMVILLAGAIGALTFAGHAQDLPGDPALGRIRAAERCAECHRIGAGETATGRWNAPAFQALAADPKVTEFHLRTVLRTPHPTMPMLILERDELDHVVSYVLSLKAGR